MYSRTCTSCRARKIKCDRQRPCGGCSRTGTECVYPTGPGRAPKQQRRVINQHVLDRLSHLEILIKSVAADAGYEQSSGTPKPSELAERHQILDSETDLNPPDRQLGRLVLDDCRSAYVSNIFWAGLGDEIEELRDLLDQSEKIDEYPDDEISSAKPSSSPGETAGENAAVLGLKTTESSLFLYHPPMSQAVALFETFKADVAPLVHIFHMPTLIPVCWKAFSSPDLLDRDTEALMFAIYYSAVISMETKQCEDLLGFSRAAALKHYRYAMQQAMARADILNTQSLVFLQAVVLFVSSLRCEDASRTCWSLTALVFHNARAMGLHRDGTGFGLSPLETELRRRLWWHICFVDIRSSEYHGFEPITHDYMFSTRMPLNINDIDLTAEMTEPPTESDGPTEMTFCLIRCEVTRVGWKTCYVQSQGDDQRHLAKSSFSERVSLVKDLEQILGRKYPRHRDGGNSFFEVCEAVKQLTIARTWLVLYYPLCQKDEHGTVLYGIRDKLFSTSLQVLELTNKLLTDLKLARWRWHARSHVQWHVVAFVLSEICSRPSSHECDRAWGYVQTIYAIWSEKESKGNMWLPIKRLISKAQRVREAQKADQTNNKTKWRVAEGLRLSPSESLSTTSQKLSDGSEGVADERVKTEKQISDVEVHSWDQFFDIIPSDDILNTIHFPTDEFDIENTINNWVNDFQDPGVALYNERFK